MRALVKLFAITAVFAAAGATAATGPKTSQTDVIQGMGERMPAGKANVSLSPLFKVYTFDKAGLRFVQINSLKDEVITVISATPGTEAHLPIGSAAEQQMVAVNDEKNQPLGMVTASASCPCNATVVYRDANTTIVVIYGNNGEYITSYVIKSPQTKPPQ